MGNTVIYEELWLTFFAYLKSTMTSDKPLTKKVLPFWR